MQIIIIILVILSLIILLFTVVIYNKNNKKTIIIRGEKFKVYNNHKDKYEAALLLNKSNRKILKLIEYMKNKSDRKDLSDNLKIRYNPSNFIEGNKSFTLKKGKKISLCLRDEKGNLYNENIIMFVLLHEISHVAINSHDHTEEFWQTFKVILQDAVDLGIYKPENYAAHPFKYCGIVVKHNPYYS